MKFAKKNLLLLFFYLITLKSVSQYISVNDNYTAQQLVENVLLSNSPCANATNFSVSGGNFASGEQSFGYFNASGSSFPFAEGIVLSTSRAVSTQGPNNSLLSEDAPGWGADPDLNFALGISNTSNATILEFDFTPITNHISFDYIFASEEYHGTAPCRYSDGFAFLLKEAGSTNPYQNLALVPNTQIPVKVTTVHLDIPGGCVAQNAEYFGNYNGVNAPINFDGQTTIMKAQATVIPGTVYHIKLVIADETNPQYDSALFLGAGTFNIGADLGPDQLIATNNPVCEGENYVLDATLPGTNSYKWYKDGNLLPAEINPIYTVIDSGVYTVEITLTASACVSTSNVLTSSITIEYVNLPVLNNQVLFQCDDNGDGISVFNLTKLDNLITSGNSQINSVTYYPSLADAQLQTNSIVNPSNFQNTTLNQVIASASNNYGCYGYATVNLMISNNTIAPQSPFLFCDYDANFDGQTPIDLTQEITPSVLTGLPSGLRVDYYSTENDAITQTNVLPNIFTNTTAFQQIIFARIVNGTDCYGIIPITINVPVFNPSNLEDETIYICDGETLDLEVPSGYTSYLWSTGDAVTNILISIANTYTVTVTNSDGCEKVKSFFVIRSERATINSIDINDFNGNGNKVTINSNGTGNYEYSLDGILYQNEPLFSNVPAGEYTAFVRDKFGCGVSKQIINVLDYPKFFTPNGDGINDTWNIKGENNIILSNAIIYIYNRFGKLITQITPNDNGWNGNYEGNILPSDDFWFTIFLAKDKSVKGHFSLKR